MHDLRKAGTARTGRDGADRVGAALWRLRPRTEHRGLPAAYANALHLLARRGLERAPSDTARDFSDSVRAAIPSAGPAFDALTASYLGERFGGYENSDGPERLKELRAQLREFSPEKLRAAEALRARRRVDGSAVSDGRH